MEYLLFFSAFDAYVNCEILAIPAKYDFKPYAYGLQKDSPYLPLFNYYLNEMKEKGSLEQIKVKYTSQPQVCPDYSGKSLGIGSVFTAFAIFFFGVAFAIILFCLEIIAQLLRLDLKIFNSYGVLDCSNGHAENNSIGENEEIRHLKDQILSLNNYIIHVTNKDRH